MTSIGGSLSKYGQVAVTWLSKVGTGLIKAAIARGRRPCNGGGEEVGTPLMDFSNPTGRKRNAPSDRLAAHHRERDPAAERQNTTRELSGPSPFPLPDSIRPNSTAASSSCVGSYRSTSPGRSGWVSSSADKLQPRLPPPPDARAGDPWRRQRRQALELGSHLNESPAPRNRAGAPAKRSRAQESKMLP